MPMDLELFSRLLAAHGPDFARWPRRLGGKGRKLRDLSPAARAAWEAALRRAAPFDAEPFDAGPPDAGEYGAVDAARLAAVIDGGLRRIRNRTAPSHAFGWLLSRPLAAAFAATMLAGWVVGLQLAPLSITHEATTVSALSAMLELSEPDGDLLLQ